MSEAAGADQAIDVPSISVVTPSFNQAGYLERTLRSVLDQGYERLEYLVLDGGSTDGSAQILESYGPRLAYWVSERDNGQSAAINSGWRRSSGDILGWINSDDYYLPGALQFVGDYFARHPETAFVYGRCEVVDADGVRRGLIGHQYHRAGMLNGIQPMPQPSTFIRRSLFEAAGPIDESLQYAMDFDFFLRAAGHAVPVFIDRPLAAFTVHQGAKTSAGRARSRQETFEVALRYARGWERLGVRARAFRAQLFHALPASLKRWIDLRRDSPVTLTWER